MENASLRAGAFVTGGLFIGLWLFLGLFETSLLSGVEHALWWFWGFVGLAIAGGLIAGRVASPPVRVAIWVGLGIAVGMLIGAAIFQRVWEAMAALFTAGGGAIIVSALAELGPGVRPSQPMADENDVEDEPRARPRRGA